MSEKTEELCEMSLKSPTKTASSIVCTLKVPNFFTQPKYTKSINVYSTPFEFANTTWRFRFCVDEEDGPTKSYVVNLLRLNFEMSQQRIFNTIVLLDAHDKVYHRTGDVCDFDGNEDNSATMGFFYNYDPDFDRRDNLTMFIHLISAEENFFNVEELPLASLRGKSLSQDFQDVFLNGEDHNLTFNVCGTEFKAHRDILKSRSEVFHSMLNHDMLEKNSNVISVSDCDPHVFEQFLYYVYSGEVKALDESNMFGLYYTADKYDFTRLKDECSAFIKNSISVSNICDVIELASKHTDVDLFDCALSYFDHNADVIWPSIKWQSFLKENYILANEFIAKSFVKSKDNKAKRLKTS